MNTVKRTGYFVYFHKTLQRYIVESHLDGRHVLRAVNKMKALNLCIRLNERAKTPYNRDDYKVM